MLTGTGEVLIETLLTEAADSVQATTGAKTLPVSKVSTKQDDVLRLAKATLGCTTDASVVSFLPRTVPEWNRLDAEIIETDCVEEFKQKLAPFMYMVK